LGNHWHSLANGARGVFCGISRDVGTAGALVGGFKGNQVDLGGATRGGMVGTTGAAVRSLGDFVGFDVGAIGDSLVGSLVDARVGDFTGGFVGLKGDTVASFAGARVGAFAGDLDGAVGVRMLLKFHFGPMYLHPSLPYSTRPGHVSSSPALLGGPLPHWISLYQGRPSHPGPGPRSVQTCCTVMFPKGVDTTITSIL
jgi:hypothetical protein